jgi:hypothetical protein
MSEEIAGGSTIPKRKRRPNATPQEKAEWARRFRESGLRQREFCQQHGLGMTTLQRWLLASGGTSPSESPLEFKEVKLTPPLTSVSWVAELCRPNGIILRVGPNLPSALLEQLLRVC